MTAARIKRASNFTLQRARGEQREPLAAERNVRQPKIGGILNGTIFLNEARTRCRSTQSVNVTWPSPAAEGWWYQAFIICLLIERLKQEGNIKIPKPDT